MMNVLRLLAIVAVAVAFGACSPPRREMPELARISPTNGWAVSAPEEQGIDSEALIKGYQGILDKGINVHAMLIVRNGRLVSEANFSPYSADDMINVHSCTKSILPVAERSRRDRGPQFAERGKASPA